MPAQIEPRGLLNWGWDLGESGWKDGVDDNWLRLGRFGFHLSVIDRDLTEPPAEPEAGDSYIVGTDATDAWEGLDGSVVVWTGAEWASAAPRPGWLAYVEDEEVLTVFKPAGWSTGIAI